MPAPVLCARESEDKDTAKTVNFNVLIIFFKKISKKISYLCSADPLKRLGWVNNLISKE